MQLTPLFEKRTVCELTEAQLTVIDGGSTGACAITITVGAVAFTVGMLVGAYIGSQNPQCPIPNVER